MMSLTSQHFIVFTTLLVHIAFVAIVCGVPTGEPSLRDSILKLRCINFPPSAIKVPDKCSDYTLSSTVDKDLFTKDNRAFYLCAALLDSTKRLCPLVNNNKEFRQRVEKALVEGLPSVLSISDDDKFCAEMNYLDPNTTMDQAKFVYGKMMEKTEYCSIICGTGKDESTAESQPLCKSIQFAHQQIHVASELQKSLNNQAHMSKGIESSVELKSANREGSNVHVESETHNLPSAAQLDPKDIAQRPIVLPQEGKDESRTIETNPANEKQPSQSASSQVKNDPGSSKSETVKASPAKTIPSRVIAPAPLQLNAEEKSDSAKKSKLKPADQPNLEGRPEGGKEDNMEMKHDDPNLENMDIDDTQGDPPGDVQNEAQQENQNEGQLQDNTDEDNLEKQEEDEDIAVNGAQESNKDVAEKPAPAVEKKASIIGELPTTSHQKVSSEVGRTSSQFGNLEEAEDSHFFAYFLTMSALCTLGYLVYHNKRKIIAMAVEGKKGRNAGRRRPNSASYHKLDSNLEEAMSSNLTSTNSYVIY